MSDVAAIRPKTTIANPYGWNTSESYSISDTYRYRVFNELALATIASFGSNSFRR
ncbi:hypothetical protein EV132_11886 [Rhizobium sullae]|uniref:Uncharacterized protein n=1 Tax=Rhizobium sullae TaxID=50338 RepID=A0A4R3Q2S5_RHISU|nr:hypothetical protein EV132_11886 [Rhizobium sullae]